MNDDFFNGFDTDYIFYEKENDFLFSFYQNNIGEISIEKDIYQFKWRFLKDKSILEIYIPEITKKIIYKIKILKNNKDENIVLMSANYLIKTDDIEDNQKGKTEIIRKKNTMEDVKVDTTESKFKKIAFLSIFMLIFLLLVLLSSFIDFFKNSGIMYASAIILTIQILFINKIKTFADKIYSKYKEKVKNIFIN